MLTQTQYVASWLAIFLLMGAIWYVVDRRIGVRIYRWFYNMTHKAPLPADVKQGFIYNRKAKDRCAAACMLSIFQTVLAVFSGNINPFVELLTFFLEVPVLMTGFYLGPLLYRLWRRKDALLEKVDQIESGETSVSKELKDVSQATAEAVRDVLGNEQQHTPEPSTEPEPQQPEQVEDQQPDTNPRDMIKHYTQRNSSEE